MDVSLFALCFCVSSRNAARGRKLGLAVGKGVGLKKIERNNLQNSSPAPPCSSPSLTLTSKHLHSHSGYSSSGNATGSSLPFKKFKPFNGVPAGQLDTGICAGFAFDLALAPRASSAGEGVRGLENGCARPVDVAAGVPPVRGDAVVSGANWREEDEKERDIED